MDHKHFTPMEKWEYFPRFAVFYFFWSIVVLVAAILLLEKVILPFFEDNAMMSGKGWQAQHLKVCRMMFDRNKAQETSPLCWTESNPVAEKSKKSKRILVIGDSYVWGYGVINWNHIWWRQLESELWRNGYRDVEVIGAGWSGVNTREELSWVPQLLNKYHPDLIIWSYVTNDPCEYKNNSRVQIVPNRPSEDGYWKFLHPYLPNIAYHLVALKRSIDSKSHNDDRHGYDWDKWELKLLEGKNFEQYKQTLQGLAQLMRKTNTKNVFTMMVFPDRSYYQARLAPVEKVMKENNLDFYDFTDSLVTWYEQRFGDGPGAAPYLRLGVSPADSHPGPILTHFYAIEVAKMLEQRYKDCIGHKFNSQEILELPRVNVNPIHFNDWVPLSLHLTQSADYEYKLSYPKSQDEQLFLPIKRPFVQLNLEVPARMREIQISGDNLKSSSLALGLYDPQLNEYEQGKPLDLGTIEGKNALFKVPHSKYLIAELWISANFTGENRNITLKITNR
ncbi:MAG: SGNH/GDSL hydrolase family protein [Candidatus Obscuribacterales bacterium]|nr:SGNH/GDSL hydrolase family protein [Candidatus Obscuribacterales bacterium]